MAIKRSEAPKRQKGHSHDDQAAPAAGDIRITVAEAAHMARVCTKTVLRWASEGRFVTTRPIAAGSGRRYVDRASLERFLAGGL